MHLADGSLDSTTTMITSVAGVAALATACYFSRKELSLKKLPGFALMTGVVLVAQMINYSTGFGFSGHLLGAALLAILFGPFSAMLGIAGVQVVQVSLLGDGALSTMGANFLSMGVVAPLTAFAAYRGLQFVKSDLTRVSLASFASILGASLVMGAIASVSWSVLFSTHAMIGLYEAILSGVLFALVAKRSEDAASFACALKPLTIAAIFAISLIPSGSELPDGLEKAMTTVATLTK